MNSLKQTFVLAQSFVFLKKNDVTNPLNYQKSKSDSPVSLTMLVPHSEDYCHVIQVGIRHCYPKVMELQYGDCHMS